jgi:UDP-glucose 4-epimerase
MRAMVTGAETTLGRALVAGLLVDPATEVVLAVDQARHDSVAGSAPGDPRWLSHTCDLVHARHIHDLVYGPARELAIDTVVHLAHPQDPHVGGGHVHAEHVDGPRELVLACASHPTIKRFVYRSFGEVYAQHHVTTSLIDEDSPLDLDPTAPQWLRDRVEADLVVMAAHHGALRVAVLRCAEILAASTDSQLWDYLASRVCLRPAGFDPMINVLSLDDAVAGLSAAARTTATGAFNIPGADTLPLSRAIVESNRAQLPVPGRLMSPLYKLRHAVAGFEFRYDLNVLRFHFGGVLDGSRARRELGYEPHTRVNWPQPWWWRFVDRLDDC